MASPNAVDDKKQPNHRPCPSDTIDQIGSGGLVPIRTVCVLGITHWHESYYNTLTISEEIHNHFGQFGEIESVSIQWENNWTRWCLVQFKRAKDAEEALLRTGKHWTYCDVKAADPWHQPDHPLQVAPEQDSVSNISVALNDDCLQAIFERLKLSCLTNVAGVCKRFNEQAKKTFASKHKHLDIAEQLYRHRDLLESAMKIFGKDIQSLCIVVGQFLKEKDAIRMIGQNCGPKLKQLELCNFRFQIDLSSLRPLFAQIDQLKLDRCANSIGLVELMAGCGELKSLSLMSCNLSIWGNGQHLLSGTFPKLQELIIRCEDICDETFENFVTRHPTLIKLSFDLQPCLLRTIGQHARNLQELEVICVPDLWYQFQNDAAYIGQLSSLKKIELVFEEESIVPVLDALVAGEVPIERMEIKFIGQLDVDRAIKCISQLKRIKILQLGTDEDTRRVTDADVVELAKCLPELEELHLAESHYNDFDSDYEFKSQLTTIGLRKMLTHANKMKLLKLRWIDSIKIDVDDYKAMLSMVQKRKVKVPLVIEFYGRAEQITVPTSVLAENRSTFNIIINNH